MKNNKQIRLFVMDVDGTLTDGAIYIGNTGEVMKAFHVKDGYAIAHLLPEQGIIPVILTGRQSAIVEQRARELQIQELHQGVGDKLTRLKTIASAYQASPEQIAYVGDDVNDLECMKWCGLCACPADACRQVREIADYVSALPGGRGAVRDVVEWLIN